MELDNEHYLIPRRDGKILVGSSVEYSDFDKFTTEQIKQQLTEFALKVFPALAAYPLINHWAGLRPASPNGIPYISRHPEIENLSVNAGHFRNGLTMAPASAELLVDLILKRPPKIDPQPFAIQSLLAA